METDAGHKVLTCKRFLPEKTITMATISLTESKGFSSLTGVVMNTRERKQLERVCRIISRPALLEGLLEFTDNRMVRYALKNAYRDGTTHVCAC